MLICKGTFFIYLSPVGNSRVSPDLLLCNSLLTRRDATAVSDFVGVLSSGDSRID